MTFDLKKFLTENKLTKTSRIVDEIFDKKMPEGKVVEEVTFQDDSENENLVFTISKIKDSNYKTRRNTYGVDLNHETGYKVVLTVVDTDEEFDITPEGDLDYIILTGIDEEYWREGTSNDTYDFVINETDVNGEPALQSIEGYLMKDEYLI